MNTDSLVSDISGRCRFSEASDDTLVVEAKAGESAAFVEICNRYSKWIFRTIYRITRNREDAEDALQEAFLKGFVHLESFDGRSKFSTWLTRIAINSALMTLRKRRTRREISIDIYADDETWQPWEIPDQTADIELQYLRYESDNHLRKAVERLHPVLREVIEIQRLHDGSIREIAQIAGISVAATKSRLVRAKAALRGRLAVKRA
jgi:RNA polymerase sigma-70 factor (ECF subfamily)